MPPDARSTPRLAHARSQRSSRTWRLPYLTPPSSDLEAPSTATPGQARNAGGNDARQRGLALLLTAVAALLVGAVVTWLLPVQYLCGATLRLKTRDASVDLAALGQGLLTFAWRQPAEALAGHDPERQWFVDHPEEAALRLCLKTADRKAGLDRVRTVAEGYLAKLTAERRKARDTPTESEHLLSEYVGELQARLDEAQSRLEDSRELLPPTDPQPRRDSLLSQWETLRVRFSAVREELNRASAELQRLQAAPEPTHGIVDREVRRAALMAHLGLQQDLRELEVNLVELKRHVLTVGQKSAVPLQLLVAAIDSLGETLAAERAADPAATQRIDQLSTEAKSYREVLFPFVESWKREFVILAGLTPDPLSSELLDAQERARTHLNDFLFAAGKHLTAMRSALAAIGEDAGDLARYHVLQSNLMRAFRVLQSTHHRFEFAAGMIDARDNFQIDAALRSSRGLHRRSQHRIRLIDERLQRRAAEQARRRRLEEIGAARRTVARVRSMTDAAVLDLITLQEELNVTAGQALEFLRIDHAARLAEGRATLTRTDLEKTRDRLADLAARRMSAAREVDLKLIDCRVIGRSADLPERLRLGGLAALVTFLIVGFGQWLISRRQSSQPRPRSGPRS